MTSAAAMISSGGASGGGGGGGISTGGVVEGGTTIRPNLKHSRTSSLVPADSIGRSSTRSPPSSSSSSSISSASGSSTSPALPMAGMMMHEPERIRMRGQAAGSQRRRVKDFNDSITCTLCNGYLVEATSVNDCLHAFCRSCIVKYLECNKYCPRCKSYNSKPITVANLRPDRTLRALVYKLVPGLHKSENQRIVQFYASISSNIVSSADDPAGQGTFQLLDDQNFFSPDEPISLSLEYHYDTLAEHNASSAQLPITYLQCPAAVTVHHLYKFILTKNGLQVGSDNVRVEIIYEEEILPHDFTLMDVAYCFDYKRIAPMRFFYRILIHPTAKLAPTASAYHHRVEGQDKNSTNSRTGGSPSEPGHPDKSSTGSGSSTSSSSSSSTAASSATPVKTNPSASSDGQLRPNSSSAIKTKEQPAGRAPREATANNSATAKAAVNGHHHRTKSSTTASDANRTGGSSNGTKPSSPGSQAAASGLKMVLIPKAKLEPTAGPAETQRSPPPLKAIQQSGPAVNGAASKPPSKEGASANGKEKTSSEAEKSPTGSNSALKCYVNLKTQTIVGPGSSAEGTEVGQTTKTNAPAEIPRLKIDLKGKLSIPREKTPGLSPPSSSSSSAATSPSSATSSAGKSPVWPMGKEEYAKTIGLKPVYAGSVQKVPHESSPRDDSSHSHRKRKKGKHSKEAGSSGKRRKLHAEISSQHDASLKMKVKLTEKPPKHERLKSSGNEEEASPQPKSPPATVPEPVPSPPKPAKVIDITKDDDEVKFVKEQKVAVEQKVTVELKSAPKSPTVNVPPVVGASAPSNAAKDKLNEMRNVRHKPMVCIPNLDRSLSADLPSVGSTMSSLLESVGAKVPTMKPAPALIPTSAASSQGVAGKSQPRTPMLSRPMPSCPPLAYPLVSSPVTSSTTGSIRTMAAAGAPATPPTPTAIKRSISTDSNGTSAKIPRLEQPSLMAPVTLVPAKHSAPIQAPMFNFAKGANRAKAAQQAAGLAPSTQHTGSDHIPYRSPISASYTKEIPSTKKPIPNLLLPPATVSVTKMSDIVSSSSSASSPAHDGGRPAVEILRIPPNAPVADKPTLAPFVTPKTSNKTTRPPPATIPLIKIKKPSGTNEQSTGGNFSPPGMTPLTPPGMRPKPPVRTSSEGSLSAPGSNILDLSGGAAASSGRQLSDDVIILDHSPVKGSRMVDLNRGKPSVNYSTPVKRLPEMISFPSSTSAPSTMLSQTLPGVQKTLAPLPKLTEINRHRSLTVRQPNASIRSIPNPSALAFRGTQAGTATSVSSSTHTSSSNSSSSSASRPLMSGFVAPGGQQVNRTNGTANNSNTATSMTSSSTTVKSNTSLSNGSQAARALMGIGSSNSTHAKTTSSNGNGEPPKPSPINGSSNTSNNNNNNNKVANANTGLTAKKTIEKVAAVLKAAAAVTVDTPAPSTSPKDDGRSKSPRKEDFSAASSSVASASTATTTTTAVDSLSMAGAVAAVSRVSNKTAHADSIVTSGTVTAPSSIASVTGAAGGSSRNSPASIVNVG
ncbi:protein suppressor 2 of zeste [Anopheles arabiensis]|uniref:protein suppressor 2 of zeste n=1 Tax=Anopheles arabiensis TaxID=7173 RepID=UPI001AAE03D9|nr:protein suppressor 2 of zeste [Anopheles arabiensis]XP_040152307.1 protein suppressor 2 of zeste [Anopheles arabiensis]